MRGSVGERPIEAGAREGTSVRPTGGNLGGQGKGGLASAKRNGRPAGKKGDQTQGLHWIISRSGALSCVIIKKRARKTCNGRIEKKSSSDDRESATSRTPI